MKNPKVSLITVSYNSEKTIRDTIESVLLQNYETIEYIIIDGGSTDSTLEIINGYKDKIQIVVSEPDQGIYDAMNKGVRHSSGDIIGVINSDDFYPNKEVISSVVEKFIQNPSSELVLGAIDFVKASDVTKSVRKFTTRYFTPKLMRFGVMPPHPAAFIKKSAYLKVGDYKLGYKIAADFDLLLRMLKVNQLPFTKLNKVCVRMRLGGVSTEGMASFQVISKELLQSLNENNVYSNSTFVLLRVLSKVKQLVFT
jgi:glycosyltransferase involved in cell wall biosynthesis